MVKINFVQNMRFEIKNGFMPNLSQSESLEILEVTNTSIVIQMDKAARRGVFPTENFQYWVKKGLLVQMEEHQKTS